MVLSRAYGSCFACIGDARARSGRRTFRHIGHIDHLERPVAHVQSKSNSKSGIKETRPLTSYPHRGHTPSTNRSARNLPSSDQRVAKENPRAPLHTVPRPRSTSAQQSLAQTFRSCGYSSRWLVPTCRRALSSWLFPYERTQSR